MTADAVTAGAPPAGVVVFDLDGVIVDTEHLWEEAWAACCAAHDTPWTRADTVAVQGMSAPEWSRHLAAHIGPGVTAEAVHAECVGSVVRAVAAGRGPLLPGARALVTEVAALRPIALASSAAREVIDVVLAHEDLAHLFAATVSSGEVARGKPAPDVYREAVRRLHALDGRHPGVPVGVEDSGNGIRAAKAAGLVVVAIPNPVYPPAPDALALADHVAADHADALAHLLRALAGTPATRPR